MGIQIVEFETVAATKDGIIPIPEGKPSRISVANFTGVYTVGGPKVGRSVRVVQISGTGQITWPGLTNPEVISSPVARLLLAGEQFTVA